MNEDLILLKNNYPKIIEYIKSEMEENNILIYENVVYESLKGIIKADNILMNLTTKNIDVFMNNTNDKINVSVN